MKDIFEKPFRVSDGVMSLAGKKIKDLVSELQAEGALTKQEGLKVLKGLQKVKKTLYDSVTAELKKAVARHAAKKKSPKKTSKARKKRV